MDTFRVFLHLLSASVWVGGQIALAGMVPTVRSIGPDAVARITRAFARVAWPAFAVAVVTGLWNLVAIPLDELSHPWIELKLLAVLLSGAAAAVPLVARDNRALVAASGAASSVFAVASMYLGLLVTTTP